MTLIKQNNRLRLQTTYFTTVKEEDKQQAFAARGLHVDDKGRLGLNANIFATYVLERMNLVQIESGQIFIYDGREFYVELNDRILKTICRDIIHEAENNIWQRKWESEYIEALRREVPFVDYMNPEKDYINLTNGMLNIYTRELEEHHPDFLSTIQIPIEYKEDAQCPEFIDFLNDIFEDDQERVNLIQELLGYCFLHDVKIQKAFIFVGVGSNGKSVLAEIIRNLIGVQNVSSVALNELGGKFGMQNLPEKLVNISSENEFNKKFNTQNFKMLTSGDAVNVEQKYKDSFNTVLFAKVIVLLNRMMDSDDMSNGYYRRLQIVPFNKVYKELKANETPKDGVNYMDKTLTERLLKELSGILLFALEGLKRLIENDFNLTDSKVCEKALEEYKIKQNPVIEYFNDRIVADSDEQTLRPNFKKDFSLWAMDNGHEENKSIGSTKFWSLFRKVLIENNIETREKKMDGNMYITGIRIVSRSNAS